MCSLFRVVALVIAVSAIGVTVVRADDLCGATIVADLTLDQDLFCVAGGLIVAADGISLQLNGHTINGSGTGVGIGVRGRRQVSIKGGTARGFESGIMLANSQHVVIMEMMFTQNREGIFVSGSTGVIVKENVAWANFQRGFMIRPSSTQTSRLRRTS
jgi:nitrous oxidase accessory protein NosD